MLVLKICLSILLTSLLQSCAKPSHSDAVLQNYREQEVTAGIIGGIEAAATSKLSHQVLNVTVQITEEPVWNGFAMIPQASYFQCSAVAISKRVILSAAHCWKSDIRAMHSVKTTDESGQTIEIPVLNKKIHDRYKIGNLDYDLALFQLAYDLPKHIQLARLPEFQDQITPRYVNAAGFGKSVGTMSSEKGTGILRIVTLLTQDYSSSSTTFSTNQRLGKGVCQGDSGGPAYAIFNGQSYLVGIVSMTEGQESGDNIHRNICDKAGIFIKVDNNLDWIKKYTDLLNTGHAPPKSLFDWIE